MSDDFPTVNTDFECRADGWECEANLDVSLNLDIAHPHPFTFSTPIDRFTMPLTTPLHYQIAWKLHQTIVRPRFKDLYDLSRLAPAIGSLKAAGCNELKRATRVSAELKPQPPTKRMQTGTTTRPAPPKPCATP